MHLFATFNFLMNFSYFPLCHLLKRFLFYNPNQLFVLLQSREQQQKERRRKKHILHEMKTQMSIFDIQCCWSFFLVLPTPLYMLHIFNCFFFLFRVDLKKPK